MRTAKRTINVYHSTLMLTNGKSFMLDSRLMTMTDHLIEHFRGFPSQEKVARLFLRHGIRVADGKA